MGEREGKYQALLEYDVNDLAWQQVKPETPWYFFVPWEMASLSEYKAGWKITDLLTTTSTGVKTHRDHFVIDYDQENLVSKISEFRSLVTSDSSVVQKYNLPSNQEWKLAHQRHLSSNVTNWIDFLAKCRYRPFDDREIYYHADVIDRSREEVMQHMLLGQNIRYYHDLFINRPRIESQSEVVEANCNCDNAITCSLFPKPDCIL